MIRPQEGAADLHPCAESVEIGQMRWPVLMRLSRLCGLSTQVATKSMPKTSRLAALRLKRGRRELQSATAARLLLALLRPPQQRADRAGDVERAFDERFDAIGNWHVDPAGPGHLGQRQGGERALGEPPFLAPPARSGPSRGQSRTRNCAIAPRSRSGRGRRGPKVPSASNPLAPNASPKRRNSAKPRATSAATALAPSPRPAATPQAMASTFFAAPPISTPGRRSSDKAEVRPVEEPAKGAREALVAGGKGHCGRQARRDVGGEGWDLKGSPRVGAAPLAMQDFGHERVRAALDALGAGHSGADPGKAASRAAVSRVAWAGDGDEDRRCRAASPAGVRGRRHRRGQADARQPVAEPRRLEAAASVPGSRPHSTTSRPAAAAALASAIPQAPAPATPISGSFGSRVLAGIAISMQPKA